LVVGTLVTPHAALAQAVIAGSVKDTSGAVLPGVTVEASSPALIEKVRSAVSDGNGVYRIEDLVFRQCAHAGQQAHQREPVLQPERGQIFVTFVIFVVYFKPSPIERR
jgi:hypothetical protein